MEAAEHFAHCPPHGDRRIDPRLCPDGRAQLGELALECIQFVTAGRPDTLPNRTKTFTKIVSVK